MSTEAKNQAESLAKWVAIFALIGAVLGILKGVWVIASGWENISNRVLSIEATLKQQGEQSREFQKNIDERLRRLENRIGFDPADLR